MTTVETEVGDPCFLLTADAVRTSLDVLSAQWIHEDFLAYMLARRLGLAFDPTLSGQPEWRAWPPVDDSKLAQALASKIQHDQCYAIRQAIVRRYGPEGVAGYIRDSNGKVTDQFRRALRGEAVLQPRDLAYAIHHFGDDLDVSSLLAGASA